MTSIPGPFNETPPDEKRRVQAQISDRLYESLFLSRLPLRGAQDKIISTLLVWFASACEDAGMPRSFQLENETIAIKILDLLCQTTFGTLVPTTPPSSTCSDDLPQT